MNGKELRFKITKENERRYVELYIPKETEAAEISLNYADKPQTIQPSKPASKESESTGIEH